MFLTLNLATGGVQLFEPLGQAHLSLNSLHHTEWPVCLLARQGKAWHEMPAGPKPSTALDKALDLDSL